MILTAIILFGSLMLSLIAQLFSLLNFVIPSQIADSVIYFISFLAYVKPIFPIDTLMQSVGVVLSFYALIYVLKIILWAYAMLPWVGKEIPLPTISQEGRPDMIQRGYYRSGYTSYHSGKNIKR